MPQYENVGGPGACILRRAGQIYVEAIRPSLEPKVNAAVVGQNQAVAAVIFVAPR